MTRGDGGGDGGIDIKMICSQVSQDGPQKVCLNAPMDYSVRRKQSSELYLRHCTSPFSNYNCSPGGLIYYKTLGLASG